LIRIEGLPQLYKKIDKLKKQLGPAKVEPVMKEGADTLTKAVHDKAPVHEGRLRKNIVTLRMRPLGNNPASYMTKVKQGRKEAPHAHLIESGTSERYQSLPRKYTGKIPGKGKSLHPFFRPAWDSYKERIFREIVQKLKSLVESV
jgi:HK97 gp10 family phage protein